MGIGFFLPDDADVKIRARKDGRVSIVYREGMHPKKHTNANGDVIAARDVAATIRGTAKGLEAACAAYESPLSGLKVTYGATWIQIAGVVTREVAGDMMIGEFLHWGTMGGRTLSDIIMNRVTDAVPEFKKHAHRPAARKREGVTRSSVTAVDGTAGQWKPEKKA